MAAPNIVNVSSITAKTIGAELDTTTTTAILTCPTDKVLKINTINVANIDGTANADVTVYFYDSSAATRYALANTISVAADSSLIVTAKSNSIYLEEGDKIEAGASANGDLAMVISYEELDDA